MSIFDLPLDRDEVEEIIRRAELCAEATIPGQQLRDLAQMALQAIKENDREYQ